MFCYDCKAARTIVFFTVCLVLSVSLSFAAPPENNDVVTAMKKASDFMMNTVSNRGGFVWSYSADLSEQWGEIPARKSMIWVQDPGTVGVGEMYLRAYRLTGEPEYLEYAERTANVLIYGQHPSGGWHYFIDFDMAGVEQWYDEVAEHCWGWEEYYHYYGNCTFDDNVSSGVTEFLLDIYMETLKPEYKVPLLKALDFILESQYPNGGWPQRYPLSNEYPHDGHDDYTPYYTFNDEVITNNVHLLLKAYELLGVEKYLEAAHRGMDFTIISQYVNKDGVFQAGWSAQHDMNLIPAAARSYEPAAISPGYTVRAIRDLEQFYIMSGNRKYLTVIPDAITWLEQSYLPENHKTNDRVTHATFYELGTNKPLYAHREGTSIETGHYWIDYEPKNFPGHYGMQQTINVPAVRKEFERVSALSPEQAMAEYQKNKSAESPPSRINSDDIMKIISSLDNRGAWITELSIPDYIDLVNNPRRTLDGISTREFIRNMHRLIDYLEVSTEQ
ncbi:pectate lyase [Candidatus Latescibacterota bacterium]